MANDPRRVTSDGNLTVDLNYYFNTYVSLNQDDKKDSYDLAKLYIEFLLGRINAKDPRFSKEPHTVGSASQGLKVGTADEFDVNVKLCKLPRTYWADDNMPTCIFEDKCGTTPYLTGAPPGMAPSSMKIRMSPYRRDLDQRVKGGARKVPAPTKTKFGDDQAYISLMNPPQDWADLSTENMLSPKLVRQRLKSLLKDVVDESKSADRISIDRLYHGPAITFEISNVGLDHPIDVDFAPMIDSEAGFPYWVQWPHLDTTWPSEEKKKEVKKVGVNLVPKGEEKWLISYSKAERELRNGIDDETCRVRCHRIMKKLREDVWCKAPVPKGTLTSYHLKNLLFWECEKFPDDSSWSNDQLGTRFESMVCTLLRWLKEGRLEMFMNKEVNLLEDKGREALDKVITNIIKFWQSTSKYLRP